MRKSFLTAGVVLLLVIALNAGTVEEAGKAWLDEHKDPASINVNGEWRSKDWGVFRLKQAEGTREVTGNAEGYDITGVVSGNRLFMVFSKGQGKGTVDFCATVSSQDENSLAGTYSYRVTRWRFGHGLCQEKGYSLHMTKQ